MQTNDLLKVQTDEMFPKLTGSLERELEIVETENATYKLLVQYWSLVFIAKILFMQKKTKVGISTWKLWNEWYHFSIVPATFIIRNQRNYILKIWRSWKAEWFLVNIWNWLSGLLDSQEKWFCSYIFTEDYWVDVNKVD